MFHLILMLCSTSVPSCSVFDLPKTFQTEVACKAEGTSQSETHMFPKAGDGGLKLDGFMCVKT